MKTEIEAKYANLRGDDGFTTFSIRIKRSLVEKLDEKRSRNYVISRILEEGVKNTIVVDPK